MLIFEDVHWADPSLLDLIELLAARLRDLPILLLALTRPDLLDSRPGWGGGRPAYAALPLEPLRAEEARERAAQLLAAYAGPERDQQLTFKHMLVRDVPYDSRPRARRRGRHAHVAQCLEEATAEVGEAGAAIARHWRDAGDHARAIDYFMAAAEEAERGWAKEHAVSLYREALDLVTEDDGDRRTAIRRRLAVANQAAYHIVDARMLGLGGEE